MPAHPSYSRETLLAALVLLSTASSALGQRAARYSGMLSDGSRIEGNVLTDWHGTAPAPKLDGRPLLDLANPPRWLRDRELLSAEAPSTLVEFSNGDCLPGEVIGFIDGRSLAEPLVPYLIVRPNIAFKPPLSADSIEVRVHARDVRRIVWQARGFDALPPGTARTKDGRVLPFRSARFLPERIELLQENGVLRLGWQELAELHLPRADFWDGYFHELAVLTPDGAGRLMQVETTGGLVATTSLERLRLHVVGDANQSANWIHGVQPAWSVDMLWLPCDTIRIRRFFAPREVPLARVPATRETFSSLVAGTGFPSRANRSVDGAELQTRLVDFGWGFGAHAPSELHFPLPGCAESFRAWVGMDRSVGEGGCVLARVYVGGANGPAAFESPHLIGAEAIADTGLIPIATPDSRPSTLVLQLDPATDNRPPGADPLDIRDAANWFDPILSLEERQLGVEISRRATRQVTAWSDWQLSASPDDAPRCTPLWDDLFSASGALMPGVRARTSFSLVREIKLRASDRWLVLGVSRQQNPPVAPKLEVRIDGELVAEPAVPLYDRGHPDLPAIAIPVSPTADATARIEIRQIPATDDVAVRWHLLRVGSQLPTIFRWYEDGAEPGTWPADQPEEHELATNESYTGARALHLPEGSRIRLALPSALAIRERPRWGEYRFLRFAFRAHGDGRLRVELDQAVARDPVVYDGGPGDPMSPGLKRFWEQKLPEGWTIIDRDLFADLGPTELAGLTLVVSPSCEVWFDHLYVARLKLDFDLIKRP